MDIHEGIIREKLGVYDMKFINVNSFSSKSYFSIFYKILVNFMSNFYSSNTNMPFVLKISDDEDINAITFSSDNFDYICINSGVILKICDTALKLTEDKDFFPNVFKTSDYKCSNSMEYSFPPKIVSNRIELYSGTSDINRQDLAFLISYFAIMFIAYHEAGHILNGHTRWILNNDKNGLMHLEMVSNDKYNINRKTLEMDADAFAANRTISMVIANYKGFRNTYPEIVRSKEALLAIWACSISVVFTSLGFYNFEIYQISEEMYFPNLFRLILAIDAGYSFIKNVFPRSMSRDIFYEIFTFNNFKCLSSYNKMYAVEKVNIIDLTFQLEKMKKTDYGKHYYEIKKNWDLLRIELEKYARVKLADPYF